MWVCGRVGEWVWVVSGVIDDAGAQNRKRRVLAASHKCRCAMAGLDWGEECKLDRDRLPSVSIRIHQQWARWGYDGAEWAKKNKNMGMTG